MKNLEAWANDWGMGFNAKKCYILSIKNKSQHFYSLNGHILQQVQNNPYQSIFESSFLCGTVSKALEKSKMAISVCNPASYAFMKSWSVTNS
jgi:hypothetical protein